MITKLRPIARAMARAKGEDRGQVEGDFLKYWLSERAGEVWTGTYIYTL